MMPSRIEAGYNRNACSGGIRDGTYALGARKILILAKLTTWCYINIQLCFDVR